MAQMNPAFRDTSITVRIDDGEQVFTCRYAMTSEIAAQALGSEGFLMDILKEMSKKLLMERELKRQEVSQNG